MFPLPQVGLDLSASNMEDSSYRLPAVALRRLDGSGSSGWAGEPGRYLCLGADNTLYKVRGGWVGGEGYGEGFGVQGQLLVFPLISLLRCSASSSLLCVPASSSYFLNAHVR